ncbi:MAG: hypothetical protein PHU06_12500 [Gallionella sp.]|nr:hypothetical protein [Gallionella sp.]MDD4959439.1 hypothetical protein [Gallionella sp.]
MHHTLYDYVNLQGENEFKKWTEGLEKPHRAKLNEKLDKLMLYGDALHPEMLSGTNVAGIKKIRAKGNVQLRPLLCNGPINIKNEYTLLMGAKEIGGKWAPKDAPSLADTKKQSVISDPNNRRVNHERVL